MPVSVVNIYNTELLFLSFSDLNVSFCSIQCYMQAAGGAVESMQGKGQISTAIAAWLWLLIVYYESPLKRETPVSHVLDLRSNKVNLVNIFLSFMGMIH